MAHPVVPGHVVVDVVPVQMPTVGVPPAGAQVAPVQGVTAVEVVATPDVVAHVATMGMAPVEVVATQHPAMVDAVVQAVAGAAQVVSGVTAGPRPVGYVAVVDPVAAQAVGTLRRAVQAVGGPVGPGVSGGHSVAQTARSTTGGGQAVGSARVVSVGYPSA